MYWRGVILDEPGHGRPQAQKAVLSFLHSPILLAISWPVVTKLVRNGFMSIHNPTSHLILVTLVTSLMHILENGLMTSKIRWTVFSVNLTVCDERLNVFRVRLITFSVKESVCDERLKCVCNCKSGCIECDTGSFQGSTDCMWSKTEWTPLV